MQIRDTGGREAVRQRVTIELRMSPRTRKRPDIDQAFDRRALQQCEKLFERPSRMPDRMDRHGIGGPPGGGADVVRTRSTVTGCSAASGRSCRVSLVMW